MKQRKLQDIHAAIIMDGNGRWAKARGLPRVAGHKAGAAAVRRTVEAAPGLGIRTLTLYAFSSDNWHRPHREVATLMKLFEEYLEKETPECAERGIQISVIGRRDRLSPILLKRIEESEAATAHAANLHLRVAVDYSSRDAILRAARGVNGKPVSRDGFARLLAEAIHAQETASDVDLLIRTGGERRLSDFLLWECAYAELFFTSTMWPDFSAADLEEAVRDFNLRERRFGRVLEAAAV